MIDAEKVTGIFQDLIKIDSHSGHERPVADWLRNYLEKLGLEVTEDKSGEKAHGDAGNLIARLPGDGPALMLTAHMDTVEPTVPDPGVREGDIIRSRGESILGGDDKGGVAAILAALEVIIQEKIPHGPIEVVFSIGEETGLYGAKNLDLSKIQSKAAVVVDSEGPAGEFIVQTPSQNQFEVKITGKEAHAGVEPEKGLNAIAVAAEAIAAIQWGRLDPETTCNVGIIQGGTATNVVPASAVVRGEVRSFSQEKLERQTKLIEETFQRVGKQRGAGIQWNNETSFHAFKVDENHPLVHALKAAITAAGSQPSPRRSGGGSDANVYNLRGIIAVNIGMGGQEAHTRKEQLSVSEMTRAAQVLVELVKLWHKQ